MKYLLVQVVVLVAVWLWRNNRRVEKQEQQPGARPPLAAPQDMVRCAACPVHLPRGDALAGPDGRLYCCEQHRLQASR